MRHGRLVLQQLESLRQDLNECVQGKKGRIRVLTRLGAFTEVPSALVSGYIASHPEVSIELRESSAPEIARGLMDGTADTGIVEGEFSSGGLEILPYRRERLLVAASRLHPLASRRIISFSDALRFDFVALPETNALQILLTQAARTMQKPLNARVQVNSYEALCRLAEANAGIGILPESAARSYAKSNGLQLIELTDSWAIRDLSVVVRKREELPHFIREFVELFLVRPPVDEAADEN